MAQSWSMVEQSPTYQNLPPQEQQAAKQQYFSQVVAQKPEFQALPDIEKQSAASQFMGDVVKPPLQFKTNEEARKANIIARNKRNLAEVGTQGINPWINAVGESIVKTGMQALKSPVSVPSQILTDVTQKTPLFKSIRNISDVLTGKKESDYTSFLESTGAKGIIPKIVGTTADIGLYPGGAGGIVGLAKLGTRLVKAGAKGIGEGTGKAVKYVTDAFTGEAKANIAKGEQQFALKQSTNQQVKNISDVAKSEVNTVQSKQDAVNQGYEKLSTDLKNQINKEADVQGLNIQKDLPELYTKKSQEYATEQGNILKNLPEEQKVVPIDKVLSNMENTLLKFRILKKDPVKGIVVTDAELTPAESKVLSIYKDLKNSQKPIVTESPILEVGGKPIKQTVEPSGTIPVEDLIKNKQFIKPEYGKAWGSDEKLQSEIASGFGGHLPDALKTLDTKYAPFLELKNASTSQLNPFAGKYDVATEVISKSGSPSMVKAGSVDASEQRLLTDLNAAIGKKVQGKIPGLQKRLDVLPEQQKMIQTASEESVKKIRKDAADEIWKLKQKRDVTSHDIDQSVARLIHQYKTRQLKIGIFGVATVGGGLANTIKYFLHREIYSGMKG